MKGRGLRVTRAVGRERGRGKREGEKKESEAKKGKLKGQTLTG